MQSHRPTRSGVKRKAGMDQRGEELRSKRSAILQGSKARKIEDVKFILQKAIMRLEDSEDEVMSEGGFTDKENMPQLAIGPRQKTAAVLKRKEEENIRLKSALIRLKDRLKEATEHAREAETERRELHNRVMELQGNLRVFCRVRPLLQNEQALVPGGASDVVTFPFNGDLLSRGIELQVPFGMAQGQGVESHKFALDNVFAPSSTQAEVFFQVSQLVQSAMDGFKVCIFAYGQTGSGKTHTMLGDTDNPGIVPRAIDQVFQSSRLQVSKGWQYEMKMSMLEIYDEQYRDLLGDGEGRQHDVHHDPEGNTLVTGVRVVEVGSPQEVAALLQQAKEKRAVGATQITNESSRSHMVVTMKIAGKNAVSKESVKGVLNLVDLAGSERLKESGCIGTRLKETQHINKSLSALGDVILAIANKTEHVPFRNSKLTWLLQPCLDGHSKVLMFLNISPSWAAAKESLRTLQFGSQARTCQLGLVHRTPRASKRRSSIAPLLASGTPNKTPWSGRSLSNRTKAEH